MDDQPQDRGGSRHADADQRAEPVRSRWTPKPEQILILESIFNSGMVNPPKDETVRIRKMLEKFGAVGDANVFYWFQNRRSRSRRRQRQIQASLAGAGGDQSAQVQPQCGGGSIQFDQIGGGGGFTANSACNYPTNNVGSCLVGSSSSAGGFVGNHSDDLFGFSGNHVVMQEYEQTPVFCPPDASSLNNYQSEMITVFINGVATEVGRGPLDLRAMCGGDYVLVHSSGLPVQMNEYGFAVQGLHHGESYFLVPRHS